MDQRQFPLHLLQGESPALDAGLVVLANVGHAGFERFRGGLFEQHWDSGIGTGHRNARAHGARAEDADARHRVRRSALVHARHLGHGALREKRIQERFRLIGDHAFRENLALAAAAFIKRQGSGGLKRFHGAQRRLLAAPDSRGQLPASRV